MFVVSRKGVARPLRRRASMKRRLRASPSVNVPPKSVASPRRRASDRGPASATGGRSTRRAAGGGGSVASRMTSPPPAQELRCRGWQQEAALRMLENNLHPDVAEKPDERIVYGGSGKGGRGPG